MGGGSHQFKQFYSNGTYVRAKTGNHILNIKGVEKQEHFFCYGFYQEDTFVQGYIKNQVLIERIVTYISKYYGKYRTNCSALAHFLTTGDFVSCIGGDADLILAQSMTTYSGQKIKVGDTLCLLYYSHTSQSRMEKNPNRAHYRSSRQQMVQGESFFVSGNRENGTTLESEDIRSLFLKTDLRDYHFLVCVDHKDGKPVFIQQLGRDIPWNKQRAPIVFSHGGYNPYQSAKEPVCITLLAHAKRGGGLL